MQLTAAATPSGVRRAVFFGWRIVVVFATTQTIGYGTLYCAFAVLLHPVARDLHASATTVTGVFISSLPSSPGRRWRCPSVDGSTDPAAAG